MTRKVLIFWEGFPVCGLLVSELMKNPGLEIDLYATRPSVPFANFFTEYGISPKVIADDEVIDLDPKQFDLIVITGWSNKNWLLFAKLARKAGVKTCVVVDNNLRFSLRQLFGAIYFRIFLRRHFTFAYCPGYLSKLLMIFFGMPRSNIIIGNYGAHSSLYDYDLRIKRREEFIVVGQLIERKGILELLMAYEEYRSLGGMWELRIIGSGHLREMVQDFGTKCEGVIFEDFLQPTEVAARLKLAKVLILPSRLEHWGTIVCEAAACGTGLILSDKVGSLPDLLLPGVNGVPFRGGDYKSLCIAMRKISAQSNDWFTVASQVSHRIASTRNENTYANAIRFMLDD
ncbi:glycosyltransferase family 4 protein [Octadecabacter sp.]|nr:glycosyltransferase family 4 protein [Octadecabacter sp.]